MPYPSEHAALINAPEKYKTFARQNDKGGKGVDFVFGILPSGKTEIHSVRFDAKTFTPSEAKKWLKDNSMQYHKLDEATGIKKHILQVLANTLKGV